MAFSTNEGFYMPVAPAYSGGYGGMGGFGNDWIILFLLASMWGFGGFGGMGGFGGGLGIDFPWLLTGQNRITDNVNANTNAGFNQAATQSALAGLQSSVTSGFGDVQLGIAGVNQAICSTGNGITAAVTGAQNALAQQMYANQIADLNRSFDAQTASTQGMNAIQGQIAMGTSQAAANTADLKYTIASEACADRAAGTANTQAILDKLCQLELDNVKAQLEAKNDTIAQLRSDVLYARGQASQDVQTARILAGQTAEVDALYNRLNTCPVPCVPVYGDQRIFSCNNGGCNNGFIN